jgi:ATP-dependent DNA helicase RecG
MLHEGVVNAACHRDLFEKGARVMVEIFDDRVVITNPGGVPKGITPENFGTISITRNAIIAGMLHRIGYIEQMGTGIERMRNAAKNAGVAEPEFELNNFFKVTFKRNPTDTLSGRQAVASSHKRSQAVAPSDRKRIVIEYLKEQGQAKTPDFIVVTGLSDGRVRALLREMVNDGTIEKVGDNRYTHYVLKQPQ